MAHFSLGGNLLKNVFYIFGMKLSKEGADELPMHVHVHVYRIYLIEIQIRRREKENDNIHTLFHTMLCTCKSYVCLLYLSNK